MEEFRNIVIGIIVLLVTGAIALQYKSFKQWLVFGVTEAEEYFNESGTGQLKLRYVYDLAITRFPIIAKLITFKMFSKFVDVALIKMKEMIENSEGIAKILDGTQVVDVEKDEEK